MWVLGAKSGCSHQQLDRGQTIGTHYYSSSSTRRDALEVVEMRARDERHILTNDRRTDKEPLIQAHTLVTIHGGCALLPASAKEIQR